MLIRFVVNNFLSFNEECEFNLISGPFKNHKHHVYRNSKIDILKASAIYGANGAGKSNLIKAINFLKETVIKGGIDNSIDFKKFKLNKENLNKPSIFEIEFSIGKKTYSYGITLDHTNIIEEWLYESGITVDDKLIFERRLLKTGKTSISMADKYNKTEKEALLLEVIKENLLKNDRLLLGMNEYLKIEELTIINNWFKEKLVVIFPNKYVHGLMPLLLESDYFKNFLNNLMNSFDTGINELTSEEIDFDKFFADKSGSSNKKNIEEIVRLKKMLINEDLSAVIVMGKEGKMVVKKTISIHKDIVGDDVSFELSEESDGTKRLLDFIPAIENILRLDSTYIIDEIDRSLHPSLLYMMVQKIMKDGSSHGQLIFTTHESCLLDLDIFRQDEIWFVEKEKKSGGTRIYSLSDFKPRYDLDIRKGYLRGRFGAIPFLANLQDLNWDKYES